MTSQCSLATEKLFQQRGDFIIIGLTGRTGAGCTTVKEILCNDFDSIMPPIPLAENSKNLEELKYDIIYNYASLHWQPFKSIKISHVITSIMTSFSFQRFIDFIQNYNLTLTNDEVSLLKDNFQNCMEFSNTLLSGEDGLNSVNSALDFYLHHVPVLTDILKSILSRKRVPVVLSSSQDIVDMDGFTFLYQEIGKNLRATGSPYSASPFSSRNIFCLAKRTDDIINLLRKKKELTGDQSGVRIVLDSIRNPYEALYFKDRYSSFYLLSINVDENTRTSRLLKKNYTSAEVSAMDSRENPNKDIPEEMFYVQSIGGSIEISDIYINNEGSISELIKQLLKYISLILHPGLVAPTHVERTMQIAVNAKINSGCISRQVGAVVTDDDFNIKAVGWNSAPSGQIPCSLRDIRKLFSEKANDNFTFSTYELTNENFATHSKKFMAGKESHLKGRPFTYCFKDLYNDMNHGKNQVHTRSLHAEENAFLQISKSGGQGLQGGKLFTTASPCELCAKKAYQIGIKEIYYIDPYPGISMEHILSCGSNPPKTILFTGAIGRAYTQLYTPLLPMKDEISMLCEQL